VSGIAHILIGLERTNLGIWQQMLLNFSLGSLLSSAFAVHIVIFAAELRM
jgi:hypothetical protein